MPEELSQIIEDPYGRFLAACAHLQTDDAKLLDRLAKTRPANVSTRVGPNSTGEFWTLVGGKDSGKNHVHVDVASVSYSDKPPKGLVVAPEKFSEKMRVFAGQPVSVTVTGRFEIPWSDLRPTGIVRSTLFETKAGGVLVRQTLSRIEIAEGTPEATKLTFFRYKQNLRAEVEFASQAEIDDNYLRRLYDSAYFTFRSLLLEESDARTPKRQSVGNKKRRRRALG
jgi:hypothetical protein